MKDELRELVESIYITFFDVDSLGGEKRAKKEAAMVIQSYCDKQNQKIVIEVGRLNAELMDDDPFHTIQTYATNEDAIYTQRSAEDWKRMHNRVYQMLLSLEKQNKELREKAQTLVDNAGADFATYYKALHNLSDYLTKTK